MKDLARTATPSLLAGEMALIRQIVADHAAWLETPEQRHSLVIELFRQLSVLDFEALSGSPEWRTHIALRATYLSLADDELRSQIQASLAVRPRPCRAGCRVLGPAGPPVRLPDPPETGSTFEDLAALLDPAMRGLVIAAMTVPEGGGRRTRARPFGAAEDADWSLPALGLAGLASAFLEPDPHVQWDAGRVASVTRALTSLGD